MRPNFRGPRPTPAHRPGPDRDRRPTGTGRKRWSNLWKAALNAFEMTFDGRLSAARK